MVAWKCKRGSATPLHLLYTRHRDWYLTSIFPLTLQGSFMKPLFGYQREDLTCSRPPGDVVRTEVQALRYTLALGSP